MGRLRTLLRNLPNVLRGYSIYTKSEKLSLIHETFTRLYPQARSFADLGGIWNVRGSYTRYALRNFPVDRGVLVDTDYPGNLQQMLSRHRNLEVLRGDFASEITRKKIGKVDVIFFFDVLLHQANPHWDQVLSMYSGIAPCMVIYNQQYIRQSASVRLTDLPLAEYRSIAPVDRENVYQYVYEHKDDRHPVYQKPWRDIHNIFQWGITDKDLRNVMSRLGYKEAFYRNYGAFASSAAFENHGFVFGRGG